MEIVFTKHAEKKFKDLDELGIKINKKLVRKIINKPMHLDKETDYPNIIASGILDKNHILRVVYKLESGKIIVITFYPAKKGRYF